MFEIDLRHPKSPGFFSPLVKALGRQGFPCLGAYQFLENLKPFRVHFCLTDFVIETVALTQHFVM